MGNIFFDSRDLKYLGEGVIIGKTVRIRNPEKVSIGDGTIIDDFCYISASLEIGENCHIASHVNISGGSGKLTVGNYVGIASGCSIITQSSDYLSASFELPSIPDQERFGGHGSFVEIGDHVLLGAHTVVLPDVVLPEGLASAAKTILRAKQYKAWHLYMGDEGKQLMRRNNKKLLAHLGKINKNR